MSWPHSSRVTFIPVSRSVWAKLTSGNFEDEDYFLHSRNQVSFNQVIRNLHLACFWYSAKDMGVLECLERSRVHLTDNETLTDEAKVALKEAIYHLERALATPGWHEWMTNGLSIPFEIGSSLPLVIRQAWSDSMDDNPDVIDANSLEILREANVPGAELHDLHIAGWDNRAYKWPEFGQEMERLEKQEMLAESKKPKTKKPTKKKETEKESKKTSRAAAANAPTAPSKTLSKQKRLKSVAAPRLLRRKDQLDEHLEEAARNCMNQFHEKARDNLPRPLPNVLHTKSRSAKVNYVVQSILSASPTDKFVIFGDVYELGLLRDALDLYDIKL